MDDILLCQIQSLLDSLNIVRCDTDDESSADRFEIQTKLKYVRNFLQEQYLLDESNPADKSEAKSKEFRGMGNQLYRQKKFCEALKWYNNSLCYAEGESLGIGYANRSAVYFEMKLYARCIENIRMAKEAGIPVHILWKLNDRQQKALEQINNELPTVIPEKFEAKLCSPSTKLSKVADCIELTTNQQYGRHYVAKADLKPGDIVILDQPYQQYLDMSCRQLKCSHCLIENDFNLIPCPNCNKTMFCSTDCMTSAEIYHKYECPLLDKKRLVAIGNYHDLFFPLRVTMTLMNDFGSIDVLYNALFNSDNLEWNENDEQIKKLKHFHSLTHNTEELDVYETVELATMLVWVFKHTEMQHKLISEKERDMFLHVYRRYKNICASNSHPISIMQRIIDNDPAIQLLWYGGHIFPAISFINHSCAPNVVLAPCNESFVAVMADRLIKEGEQLFVNYKCHHNIKTKEHRQVELKERFKFICKCKACINDYPLLENFHDYRRLVPLTNDYMTWITFDMDELMNYELAIKKFEEYKTYLQEKGRINLSMYTVLVQYNMERVFATMCQNYSLNVRKE